MKIAVKTVKLNFSLSKPLKTSFGEVMEVVDSMDVQLEETPLEEAGYSSECKLLDSSGKNSTSEEINLKNIILSYSFGEEVTIDKDELSEILSNMISQREKTVLDVELSSADVSILNEKEVETWETSLL